MKKEELKEYIDGVFIKFSDAPNHGNNNNWWYPNPNRIAYDIKFYEFIDIDRLEKRLSSIQKEYYENLEIKVNDEFYEFLNMELECLIENLKELSPLIEDITIAGRSGGWLEIDYNVQLEENIEDYTVKELKEEYKHARELEKTEEKARLLIENRLKTVKKYVISDYFYDELIDTSFKSDEEIKENYKYRIKELQSKL